jgi:predicted RNA binding protein YcfA (HicA-like mRNA interferase family)
MLPRQTPLRELVRKFTRLGWTGPWSGGKHRYMRRDGQTVRIPNPHAGAIGIRLLREILRQAGISDDEWIGA